MLGISCGQRESFIHLLGRAESGNGCDGLDAAESRF